MREGAYACLDPSGPYRSVFDTMLPDATQVTDPFHLVKLANQALDECRHRVQNETMGHRGHKDDPLYRARRLLAKADERLDDHGRGKLLGLLDAGDPRDQVRTAWHAKEVVRSCPTEVNRLGRTLVRCSMPADPTGTYPRPSHPADFRRAG